MAGRPGGQARTGKSAKRGIVVGTVVGKPFLVQGRQATKRVVIKSEVTEIYLGSSE
jgi:hypothetical protein